MASPVSHEDDQVCMTRPASQLTWRWLATRVSGRDANESMREEAAIDRAWWAMLVSSSKSRGINKRRWQSDSLLSLGRLVRKASLDHHTSQSK